MEVDKFRRCTSATVVVMVVVGNKHLDTTVCLSVRLFLSSDGRSGSIRTRIPPTEKKDDYDVVVAAADEDDDAKQCM